MTIADVCARLNAAANGVVPMSDLRAAAKELFGKDNEAAVSRLEDEARFRRIAVGRNGAVELEKSFVDRVRRDYAGPLDLSGVDLSQGLSVVTVEDGPTRVYLAAGGAVAALSYWLAEQVKPKPEPEAAEAAMP